MAGLTIVCKGIITDFNTIQQSILKAVQGRITINTIRLSEELTHKARLIIIDSIKNTEEFRELYSDSGILRTELGLLNNQVALDAILNIWEQSIRVISNNLKKKSSDNLIYGNIKLINIDLTFNDVLSSPHASYSYLRKFDDGSERVETIPWLKWLLLEGDKILVPDYSIDYGNPRKSRTNNAIMVKVEKGKFGPWRVPPEYSGTVRNNFVTRAIDGAYPLLLQSFQEVVDGIR